MTVATVEKPQSQFLEFTQQLLNDLGEVIRSRTAGFIDECRIVGELANQPDIQSSSLRSVLRVTFRWSPSVTSTRMTVWEHLASRADLALYNFTDTKVVYFCACQAKRIAKQGQHSPEDAAGLALEMFAPFDEAKGQPVMLDRDRAQLLHDRFKNAQDGESIGMNPRAAITLPGGSDVFVAEKITNGFIRFAELGHMGSDQAIERIGEVLENFDEQSLRVLTICAEQGVTSINTLSSIVQDVMSGAL